MVMGDKDRVDRGEVVEVQARLLMAFRPYPRDRSAPLRPYGVRENVEAVHLDKERGMAHYSDAEKAFGDPFGGRQRRGHLYVVRPTGETFAEDPTPDPSRAASLCRSTVRGNQLRIEEPGAVKMVGYAGCPVFGQRSLGDTRGKGSKEDEDQEEDYHPRPGFSPG